VKMLVTGAAGFFGAALVRLLAAQGCQVFGLVRPETDLWRLQNLPASVELVACDLLAPDQAGACIERIRPELCIHLAWYVQPSKFLTSPLNLQHLQASLSLAELLAKNGCRRLVAAGTCAEYDSERGYLSEAAPLLPLNLYAASKVALGLLLAPFAAQLGLELAWARIFYAYGPFEDERRFIPAVINTLLRSEPTRLTPGGQVRDYLHNQDVAGALWAVAQSSLVGPVNIGSGVPVTNRQVAIQIGEILGRPELVKFGDLPYRAGDPMFVVADTRRLQQSTGWQPRFGLEEGLANAINWWKERSTLTWTRNEPQ